MTIEELKLKISKKEKKLKIIMIINYLGVSLFLILTFIHFICIAIIGVIPTKEEQFHFGNIFYIGIIFIYIISLIRINMNYKCNVNRIDLKQMELLEEYEKLENKFRNINNTK